MKILVTGGSGFIGSALSKKLLDKGYEVVSYELKPSKVCEFIIGDITDKRGVYEAIKGCDYVFHLAAIANLNYAHLNPQDTLKTNVEGTYIVAECCSKLAVPLTFASTTCVYGNTHEHPSTEASLCVPTEIYAATKLVGEGIIKKLHYKTGLNYNILRFGTTYGPNMRKALAIYVFMSQALNGEPLTIHGSGTQTRCLIYIDDLVEGCVKVLKNRVMCETLNLTTEEELSVLKIASLILKEIGKMEGKTIYIPSVLTHVEDRPGQVMKEQISISKAEKMLGWSPQTFFREGLKKTVEWYKRSVRYHENSHVASTQ